jgi:hypothetical protein
MKSRIIHKCTLKPLNTAKATDDDNEKQVPQTIIKFKHSKQIEKQTQFAFIFHEKDTHESSSALIFLPFFFFCFVSFMF